VLPTFFILLTVVSFSHLLTTVLVKIIISVKINQERVVLMYFML